MKNNLNRIKDYFGYSKTERNGILILFLILLLTIIFNISLPFFIKPNKTDFSAFKEQITAFENEQSKFEDSLNKLLTVKTKFTDENEIKLTPFYFDPNNLSIEKWKNLGLKEWQIEVIKNYEAKGGKFYLAKDLAKIYSISPKEYEILEPYIRIATIPDTKGKSKIAPFPFDPNKISKNELLKMGMRENLVNTIVNYRDKGGEFYSKKDFKKLYTISEEEFLHWEPFIIFEKDSLQPEVKSLNFTDTLLVNINTADTLDLQQLKGIGPAFSKRIVKYRELLGGYYDKQQLLEVYGMDENRFENIKDHIYINDGSLQKININKATIKEMIKHPYIEFYIAKSIIAYRNESGPFNDLEEIKNVKLIYEELYQKIIPYLTIY